MLMPKCQYSKTNIKKNPKPQAIKSVSVFSVIGVLSVAFRLEVDTIQNKISVRMKKIDEFILPDLVVRLLAGRFPGFQAPDQCWPHWPEYA